MAFFNDKSSSQLVRSAHKMSSPSFYRPKRYKISACNCQEKILGKILAYLPGGGAPDFSFNTKPAILIFFFFLKLLAIFNCWLMALTSPAYSISSQAASISIFFTDLTPIYPKPF